MSRYCDVTAVDLIGRKSSAPNSTILQFLQLLSYMWLIWFSYNLCKQFLIFKWNKNWLIQKLALRKSFGYIHSMTFYNVRIENESFNKS